VAGTVCQGQLTQFLFQACGEDESCIETTTAALCAGTIGAHTCSEDDNAYIASFCSSVGGGDGDGGPAANSLHETDPIVMDAGDIQTLARINMAQSGGHKLTEEQIQEMLTQSNQNSPVPVSTTVK